jgi:hypothetical protein
VSTQLLELDDEQQRHPSHTANGSYPTASVSAAAAAAGRDRYTTTLCTGTYSSGARDCRLLLVSTKLLAPAACSCMFAGAPSSHSQGQEQEVSEVNHHKAKQ